MRLYDLLKVLSEPSRLKILYCLSIKELCVYEIQDILDLSQANVSKHLRLLYDTGIVVKTKVNQNVVYKLDEGYVEQCLVFKPIMEAFDCTEDSIQIKLKLK